MESVSFDGYNGDTVNVVFLCFVFVFFVDCCFFGVCVCVCVSCIDLAQNTLINTTTTTTITINTTMNLKKIIFLTSIVI